VKPLSPTGLADAAASIEKYAWFAVFGWSPDASWVPSRRTIVINGEPEPIVNAGGIVFYGDRVQNAADSVLAAALYLSQLTSFSNVIRAAEVGVRMDGAADAVDSGNSLAGGALLGIA